MTLPDKADPRRYAFFFDFDGTLADIVEHPELVEITAETRQVLEQLQNTSSGAVAIITGRDIASIDRFLAPLKLPIAGVHGLTRRDANGQVHSPEFDKAALEAIETELQSLAGQEAGLLLERKHGALALHYRQRPELEGLCIERMELAVGETGSIKLRRGKMVIEAIGYQTDKGAAIDSFLQEQPFLGRLPLFAGDDLTDEDGFAAVNRRGGLSIKIGAGETQALARLENREALLSWLNFILKNQGT